MPKLLCFILISFIFINGTFARNTFLNIVFINKASPKQLYNGASGFDILINKNKISTGTPYFNEEYKYANIKLKKGRSFNNVKTRIDLLNLTTYFLTSNGIEINIEAGNIKEITYADTTLLGIILYKFQTGFPSFEKQTENNIYLVLSEGRCTYLELITKKVTETKNNFSGGTVYDYETFEDYFLFLNGELKRVKKDKDFILTELADKKPLLIEFIQTNKLNLKKPENITRIINYYNTL